MRQNSFDFVESGEWVESGRNKEVIDLYCAWIERGLHAIMARIEQKSALIWHSCISVTDKIKFNEPNETVATGLLYVHTEFEAI